MLHLDTDGYRKLNFRNFRIRVGYGYSKNLSDMDHELKNQYPLTSDGVSRLGLRLETCLETRFLESRSRSRSRRSQVLSQSRALRLKTLHRLFMFVLQGVP